jgi:alanine dehydrogenase
MQSQQGNGLKITMLTRSITANSDFLVAELKSADILVDATSRADTSKHIVSNLVLSELPEHGVILDITADPYDYDQSPPQVKAIEGIPTGTLDQMIFEVNDSAYAELDSSLNVSDRRLTVSCNAWPGVNPIQSEQTYGKQLLPILKVLIKKGHEELRIESQNYHERILVRSSYPYFLTH